MLCLVSRVPSAPEVPLFWWLDTLEIVPQKQTLGQDLGWARAPAHLAGRLNHAVGCALEELFGDGLSWKCVKGVCYRCKPGKDLWALGFLFSPQYLSQITGIRLVLPQQGRSHSSNKLGISGAVGWRNLVKDRARGDKFYMERIYEHRRRHCLFSFILLTHVWKLNPWANCKAACTHYIYINNNKPPIHYVPWSV